MNPFNNLGDLQKFIASSEGQKYILENTDLKSKLEASGKLLHDILHDELQKYYDSYSPVIYERTYNLLNSLKITPVVLNEGYISITVYFDQDLNMHPSLFGGQDGDASNLIDEGWEWKNNIGIHRLSFYEGFHFVDSAILRFESENQYGFKVSKDKL